MIFSFSHKNRSNMHVRNIREKVQ